MMFVATFLAGLVGVTTALQNTWWNPNNNFVSQAKPIGTIDFRYPDWVVSPRPPCMSEGVFPHPRSSDCTWYYRCTARVGIPRFATFYFECEPGTMFDDDLDQCVHPHSGSNCQGGVKPGPTPPPTPPPTEPPVNRCNVISCSYYQACGRDGQPSQQYLCAKEQCTLTGVKNLCIYGQLWDGNNGRCVNTPTPCPATPKPFPRPETRCETVISSCKNVEVCTGAFRSTQKLCRLERCRRDGQDIGERLMCPNTNELYDVNQRRCVTPPAENTCDCEFTKTNCREYDLCNPSGVRRLCDCSGCAPGMMYDPSTKVCIAKTALCPVLECVFRDSVCSCVNDKSLCTGCFMRGSLVPVSQFCKAQANPVFYHVEHDTCLYSNPAYQRGATSGHCPRANRYDQSFMQPSLQCSLRANSIIRCWPDDE